MSQMRDIRRGAMVAVFGLFFLSGFSALVLQVVWMRELSLLFGATAQAAAATLAAFFLGLAAGSAYWGRHSRRIARPLRAYALLEVGVVAAGLGYFLLAPAFTAQYGTLYSHVAEPAPGLLQAIKLLLALVLLSPAAFFMGGTLPVLSAWLVRHPAALGRLVPLLYGVNTAGAAIGALSAAFLLPPLLGYDGSYLLALTLAGGIALTAWWLSGRRSAQVLDPVQESAPRVTPGAVTEAVLSQAWLRGLAFLSGFVALALEVLWTRMFAQVLQNSVYSYAVILVVFLLALAAGSFVAGWLARHRLPAPPTLVVLLCTAALFVALTPQLFFRLTDGLGYLGAGQDWGGYLRSLGWAAVVVLAGPTLVLGVVFPYLWRAAEVGARSPGEQVGGLLALNTLGAIAGSLAAGFLLLEWLGLWRSIQWLAGLYLAAPALLATRAAAPPARVRGRRVQAPAPTMVLAPVLGFLLLLSALDAGRLPVVRTDPLRRAESLLEVREGGAGTVAVVRRGEHLGIKVDNHYTLGSTRGHGLQQRQAHFPLLLHPAPKRVFFLGMGTGITAGAALAHPVEEVVVAELLGDVIELAARYFRPYANGLFEDPRVRLLAEDGRHHLSAAGATYDVIVGDLFVPWKRGNAALYSLEHFQHVAERLAPGGLFAQWVPLYQVTEQELGTIARTFTEVFPDVTLWRGDFLPEGPIVALVGRLHAQPLDAAALLSRAQALRAGTGSDDPGGPQHSVLPDPDTPPLLLYYAGNLGRATGLLADYPLNTDDRPRLQFSAARAQRDEAAGRRGWLVGEPLIDLFRRLLAAAPIADDPYLAHLGPKQREAVSAGLDIFAARLADKRGDAAGAQALLARATRALAADAPAEPDPARLRRDLEALRAERDAAIEALEQRIERLQDG
ncbi:fused MFS/spermidine synthase [uncultured Thiohalocapsa sp.]|uniref:fused MFS/spermidine synthase n=1 Tax=uncultured Thiohalocapsa sp. TaxID=768990 RepID=UPI00260098A3|nr:fused MFS/spermidine synthase [uncultured Thiohalocapsa sp.]